MSTLIFMAFLWRAAWQDCDTGEIDLMMLAVCFTTTVLAAMTSSEMVASWGLYHSSVHEIIIGTAILSILALLVIFKKMGAADVIIFTQIFLLFGLSNLTSILFATSLLGSLWIICRRIITQTKIRKDEEIPLVPFIAIASQLILTYGLIISHQ